ncbi:LuxR C-terminal-related transcriptional regulator [Vibrio sp. SCSIO 43136]|uniref:LuxR C-terminal-related transcriptional regulator n=1 Tax=Vibrio sp. SCSIO 43136 TaxID=2819101 RepID=UPI002074B3E5|nr:LuxR C-terminal-related transcriptional regulator [Vibrio sp. SCSIO 43136]USD68047.1 hypothetical protein J4N39_17895 [Vibrio sp. SCSIO 43136]
MDLFIANSPSNVHLVIITRSDPHLSLAKLRAYGQLVEIRAADLRFTDLEAAQVLKYASQTQLDSAEVTVINRHTEGWAVGLQLVSLLLKDAENPRTFINQFSGSNSYVIDYLTEQVLSKLDSNVRDFLLHTFYLKELSAELCDHILEREDSNEMLSYLTANNLFLIPLDSDRRWYRYHHLFADVLRIHCQVTKDRMKILTWRSANWLAERGRLAEAVQYATFSDECKQLSLIEQFWPAVRENSHDSQLVDWLSGFDLTTIQRYPVLSSYYSLNLLHRDPERGMYLLETTHNNLANANKQLTVREKSALGIISVGKAYIFAAQGQTKELLTHVRTALEVLPHQEQVWRGSSRALEGIALWRDGELTQAEQSLKAAIANMDRSGDISAKITTRFLLGDFYFQFGWLSKAQTVLKEAILKVDHDNQYIVEGSADVYLLSAEIEIERGEIENALNLLDTAKQFGTSGAMQETKYRYPLVAGRIAIAENRIEEAIHFLNEAELLYSETPNPCHRPPQFWLNIIRLNQGSNDPFKSLDTYNAPLHTHSYYYMAYAIASPSELKNVIAVFETAPSTHTWPILEFTKKVLYALEATSSDEKKIAEDLLKLAKLVCTQNHGSEWISLFSKVHDLFISHQLAAQKNSIKGSKETLVEPLSAKESQVLEWLDTELSGPQIATKLFISLNTLRTHTKNIYSKLGVTNRRAAVNKARTLHILS